MRAFDCAVVGWFVMNLVAATGRTADARDPAPPAGPSSACSKLKLCAQDWETLVARVVTVEAENVAQQSLIDSLDSRVARLEALLVHFETWGDRITIRGANLQIVNGMSRTRTTNGLGNLIIGYNEVRGSGDDRSGSHMLVIGEQNNFSSFGGTVIGLQNAVSGPWSAVTSGTKNEARALNTTVIGGEENRALDSGSTVAGGLQNTASRLFSTVSGCNQFDIVSCSVVP